MRPKSVSGVFFVISLLLLSISAGAASFDEFSFHPTTAPKPPLALSGASIDSEEEILTHDNVYQVAVQVTNTRPYKVDGTVELSAFSLSESPIVLGHKTVDLEPEGYTSLLFAFSPKEITLPCTNYIFMVTTDPNSATHINERDYIFVDERREFTFADCAEKANQIGNISNLQEEQEETISYTTPIVTLTVNPVEFPENEIEMTPVPVQPIPSYPSYDTNIGLDLPVIVDESTNNEEENIQEI